MADSLEELFRAYALAFDAFDAERIASFFHCPCLMVSKELVAPLTTEHAILANMRAVVAHHRAQGYGGASVRDLKAERQADNLAIVRVRWQVFHQDESLLWDWENSYNLVDLGSGWKILVSTTHDPP